MWAAKDNTLPTVKSCYFYFLSETRFLLDMLWVINTLFHLTTLTASTCFFHQPPHITSGVCDKGCAHFCGCKLSIFYNMQADHESDCKTISNMEVFATGYCCGRRTYMIKMGSLPKGSHIVLTIHFQDHWPDIKINDLFIFSLKIEAKRSMTFAAAGVPTTAPSIVALSIQLIHPLIS